MALTVTSDRRNGTLLVALTGELDIYTVADFRETIDRIDDEAVRRIVIDLNEVSLIDSSGLGALVSISNQLRDRDGRLGLICTQQSLRRVFEITGLRRTFIFGDSFDDVRAEFDRTQEGPSDPA